MTKDTPTKHQEDHSINNDDDDDEFRSHSFRERRLTYSRHHILSDTAAAAVAELLAEGGSGDDFSDSDEDHHAAVAAAAAAAAAAVGDSSSAGITNNNNNEEATKEVSAVKGGVEILTIPTKPAASPSSGNNNKRRRRGSSFSTTSDVSKPSFYLPSRILHAGEIVRRYSNEQLKQLQQQGGEDGAASATTVAAAQQKQQQAHDVRTGAYSHPTHHATAKKYIHNHHQFDQQQNHLSTTPHRNKWRQRFSFCSTTPDHILPFPRHVVGTFSCHGMEPVYDSDYDNSDDDDSDAELDNNNNNNSGATTNTTAINNTSIAKINQDRGGIIYPYANSHNMALFAVYDGHGEGGELVSQFALGEVSRILGGRLVDGFKMLEKNQKKEKMQQCSDGSDGMKKRRRGMMLESVREEIAATATSAAGDDENDNDGDDAANEETKDEHNANDDNADEEFNIIEQSLKETFITVDRGLLDEEEIEPMYSGTTACVVLKRHQKLYVANSGDSRAVLARRTTSSSGDSQKDGEEQNNEQSFTTIPLSIDQNPDSPGEKERILDSGGYVSPPPEPGLTARVWLDPNMTQIGLAMARSIGDHAVKGVGVIAEPVVSVHTIDEELDEFVIIATDGVWEFISSEDAVDIVGRCLYGTNGEKQDASEACEALIKAATAKWQEFEGDYRDDITAMVIRLKDLWSVV